MINKTRLFAGAFLWWNDEVILMQRSLNKKLAPGMWAGVGGHIEQSEINSPITACFREIAEETGIQSTQIRNLDLRYVAVFKTEDILDSVYYFIGELKERCNLQQTNEGKLHWVNIRDGVDLEMSPHVKAVYLHWVNNMNDTNLHCFLGSDIQPLIY